MCLLYKYKISLYYYFQENSIEYFIHSHNIYCNQNESNQTHFYKITIDYSNSKINLITNFRKNQFQN
jgi:hypothetical protein